MSGKATVQTLTAAKPTFTPVSNGVLQRQCACGQHTSAGGECGECKQKCEGTLQRAAIDSSPVHGVPHIVHEVLHSPGKPLDAAPRAFMEPRFGNDFSRIPTFTSSGRVIQTKLAINKPGDEYEQEADRIADQVMAAPIPHSVGNTPPHIQRFAGQPTGQTEAAPASVDQALASPGKPLEPTLKQDMEQRFGYDFSRVRLHTDAAAEQSAREVNANAYTVGHNVVFGPSRFTPETQEGRRLIAHELAHVVQQSGAGGNHVGEKRGLSPISLLQPMIQRDFAVEPTAPEAVGRELSPTQIRNAITWNQAAFTDTDEISLLRDILGISAEPAVIDEDFVRALVQYQANYGLTQDGLLGAGTAQRLANELRAEAGYLGADADVGSATEMALNPAERRMRLRSRVVGRLGRMLHQGFIGPRDNPTGIVTARSGFTNPGNTALTNSIGINYTGSNADNSHWLQFTFSQMSAIDPATRTRVYRPGSVTTSGGSYNYSDASTFNWHVDSAPAAGSMYYEAGFTAERVAGAHTEIFDQPNRWNTVAESYAASFATRPNTVRLIKGFDTYLIVNNNTVVHHVRWNMYFNFNTSVTPTPDVAGSYEVLTAGAVSRLPADRKTVLDASFPTNTVP
jgi:hypothetical protein